MNARSPGLWWLGAATLVCLAGQPARAQIYKWVDSHNTVHFSDKVPMEVDAVGKVETMSSEPPPPLVRGGPPPIEEEPEPFEEHPVAVYPGPEPWPQDEFGAEDWTTIETYGSGVFAHDGHHDRFRREHKPGHCSTQPCRPERPVVAPRTTVTVHPPNRPVAPAPSHGTVAARSAGRGRM